MNLADSPDVMRVRDVAEILDCDPKTVYKLIDEEELDVVRVGRNYRVTRQALESYLRIETFSPQKTTDVLDDCVHCGYPATVRDCHDQPICRACEEAV